MPLLYRYYRFFRYFHNDYIESLAKAILFSRGYRVYVYPHTKAGRYEQVSKTDFIGPFTTPV